VRVEKRVNRGWPQFVLLTDISSLPMLRFHFHFQHPEDLITGLVFVSDLATLRLRCIHLIPLSVAQPYYINYTHWHCDNFSCMTSLEQSGEPGGPHL
jgi:hypothetical protein